MASRSSNTAREVAEIKSKLALRFNNLFNCYEVYSTIHGTGVFRWMKITDDVAEWYKKSFNLIVTTYVQPSSVSGGIMEISYQGKPGEVRK